MLKSNVWYGILLVFCLVDGARSAENVAATRPEMKRQLQELKQRTARLPLPPLTEEEIASGRSLVNNGRLRSLYLPPSWQSFAIPGWGGSRRTTTSGGTAGLLKALEADPTYAFKTRLFWVVSRTNNCQYCLGHQELKLRRVGMTEDEIAVLDSDWSFFPLAEQAAMKATRKLTVAPHLFNDQDLAALKPHYKDAQIIDILYTVARYNAVNRWTSSTGIPQDQAFGGEEPSLLDTPTAPKFAHVRSNVAPLDGHPRPDWESRERFETALQQARSRSARVQLPEVSDSQRVLAADTPGVQPPVWFRALANLPIALDVWAQRQAMVRDGKTPVELRTQIAWVSARENRAWYAAGHARARYLARQGNESVIYSFDTLVESVPPGHAEALRFARKLTSAPDTVDDDDVARLRKHFSDAEVAEIIQLTCDANAFDRFTESLALPLETL